MINDKINRYKLLEMVGKGATGTVYRALDTTTKEEVAVKIINLKNVCVGILKQHVNEINMLYSIRSRFVSKLIDAFIEHTQSELWMILEYFNNNSLSFLIDRSYRNNQSIPENTVWSFFIQLLLGIRTIHKYGIIHRDIKPSNILLKDNEKIAKICDFNISCFVTDQNTSAIIGTPSYIAPEIWKNSEYTIACDIFSLGCVIYELMNGDSAFYQDNMDDLRNMIIGQHPPKISKNYSTELKNILNTLLFKDPTRRVTISKILTHPFVIKKAQELNIQLTDEQTSSYSIKDLYLVKTISFPSDKQSAELSLIIANSLGFKNKDVTTSKLCFFQNKNPQIDLPKTKKNSF